MNAEKRQRWSEYAPALDGGYYLYERNKPTAAMEKFANKWPARVLTSNDGLFVGLIDLNNNPHVLLPEHFKQGNWPRVKVKYVPNIDLEQLKGFYELAIARLKKTRYKLHAESIQEGLKNLESDVELGNKILNGKFGQFNVNGECLYVHHPAVVIKGRKMGPYVVRIKLTASGLPKYNITGDYGAPTFRRNTVIHPHIKVSGIPCMGGYHGMINKDFLEGNFTNALLGISQFLNSYYSGDAYWYP